MSDEIQVVLKVNGDPVRLLVSANRTLLELLREDLGLIGTKHGCDLGDCGACTVLVDGQPRLACITLVTEVDGHEVRTIEGLARAGQLAPIQEAMNRHVAAQCGYCTPGIAMAVTSLIESGEEAGDEQLHEVLSSNICRCTGYTKILAAARDAIAIAREDEP